ncbi:DUF2064 domain-containing protein [Paenarthrobacter sp. PH39-S1]|uniref:TIGR04282 family arsenosugar biosynthesis glycosyltransferase n=1 Tax=Paenarthrobacter sp. PH39-S1 TaxID=3046204 RepID=UPI0024BAD77C|nr:DUF2064 domain-containing protein [Paenarthrobacter sp. PH39-S1]MDJ0355817.1 DUF2064 domain-containing protein [Paenarthrobacter sp. PH39-S1]
MTIAVIAKECLPGKVKTRLCPPLTAEQAASIARASLSQTLQTVRGVASAERLLVLDGRPQARDSVGFQVVPQADGGLDQRLAAICDAVVGPLLIIGMDTPQLTPFHLQGLLEDWSTGAPVHDAWLGLAADGGFWALAMREPRGDLIRGVPMSTASTGTVQLARLTAAGLSVGLLPCLQDVDTFPDAVEVAAQAAGTSFAAAVGFVADNVLAGGRS